MRKSRKSLLIDYQGVFGTEAGKAVLADLRKMAPLMDKPVAPTDSFDPYRMFLLRGRSDVILRIYEMLKKDPYEDREQTASKGE